MARRFRLYGYRRKYQQLDPDSVPSGVVYILASPDHPLWCKIGYSSRTGGSRHRATQYAEAHGMEEFTVHREFPTPYPVWVEQAIHQRLERNRKILWSGGKEVFVIRPHEAEPIVLEEIEAEQKRNRRPENSSLDPREYTRGASKPRPIAEQSPLPRWEFHPISQPQGAPAFRAPLWLAKRMISSSLRALEEDGLNGDIRAMATHMVMRRARHNKSLYELDPYNKWRGNTALLETPEGLLCRIYQGFLNLKDTALSEDEIVSRINVYYGSKILPVPFPGSIDEVLVSLYRDSILTSPEINGDFLRTQIFLARESATKSLSRINEYSSWIKGQFIETCIISDELGFLGSLGHSRALLFHRNHRPDDRKEWEMYAVGGDLVEIYRGLTSENLGHTRTEYEFLLRRRDRIVLKDGEPQVGWRY